MSQQAAQRYGYQVNMWYRHESDPDQTQRAGWNMAFGVANEQELHAEVERMRTQGYNVQRVVMHLVCRACEGNARIAKRRKNARKDARGQYACYYVDCKVCQGDGWVEAAEITV